MAPAEDESIEGVFFVHNATCIRRDWCPLCGKWTKFKDPVAIEMDHVEKRKLDCGHEITYIFLVEKIGGEKVKTFRRRIAEAEG